MTKAEFNEIARRPDATMILRQHEARVHKTRQQRPVKQSAFSITSRSILAAAQEAARG